MGSLLTSGSFFQKRFEPSWLTRPEILSPQPAWKQTSFWVSASNLLGRLQEQVMMSLLLQVLGLMPREGVSAGKLADPPASFSSSVK